MLDKYYQPDLVEEKIYKKWEEDGDFNAPVDSKNKHFSIVIPPPNVTGNLHMGHALNNTLQDILIRFYRMKGRDVLWQPGTDHAGIATEMVVERELKKQKIKKANLSREEFIGHVWKWKESSGNKIINQLKRLGCSCDWSRERFTLDEGLSKSVRHVFVKLYKDGLVYKDKRLSNWDPKLKTTISDLEVIQKEVTGTLWYIDYEIENGDDKITIATTRPETMLGDTAIAVHPEDKRFTDMIGKFAILPIVKKRIPIVADEYVKMDQGSGAVKITPAHDFNDYDLGKRHNLEIINIFNENAELNENCPREYQGLDRYTAREKIISELKEKELLSKEEENLHTVPYGDRSGEVIEPLLTDQWFVDAKKLSIEAIDSVKNGNTKFIPSNWDKVYFDWMENIQPWCVSRQLIWGHQIPAWYGPDGNIFVEETKEEAHISAKKYYGKDVELVQEDDVLDTWFSSALWPFSTLGWPEETAELEKYYPTSALVTGFDIIFFWVARMMMMGLYFTKKVPFHEVYVHALVRDEKGQKMSKSKGNVIDPLVLMDEFGADALRMALCSMAAQGRDIKLSKQRIEGYKNFINKIWNAVKLCELNNCSYQEIDSENTKNIFNKWILSEYEDCRNKTQLALEHYRFNEAANELYKFTWNIFCDWYLEFSKVIYLSKNDTDIKETRNITSYVLSNILIMFHPIMPFFTEHLWHKASNILKNDTMKINKSEWPKGISVDEKDNIKIKVLLELISSIRSTRSEMNVPANAVIDINYSKISNKLGTIFDQHKETIQSLTRSNSITEKNFSKDEGMVQVIFNDGLIYLSLKGIIDFEQEKNRLQKSLLKIENEMNKIDIKLKSENFTQNAPAEIIDEQKNRYKEYLLSKEKIEIAIKSLG
jgi:valyl-tRNA synthetase